MMASLAQELPAEIERVRNIQSLYEEMRSMPNVIVEPQIAMMKHATNEATKACAAGDVIAMLRWYEELKTWQE